MTVRRLQDIPGFSIDRVAAAAGEDPEILRLENLDTDIRPPEAVLKATRGALDSDADNSYLPFAGSAELRQLVAERIFRQTGHRFDPRTEVVITCGGTEGMLDALLATTDPGDEVVLTDPTYAGMINRVRLAGAVPRFARFYAHAGEWRLDLEALHSAVGDRTQAIFVMSPSIPSGAVLNRAEWEAIAGICRERSLWLIYNAAMERMLFDSRPLIHPAGMPGMAERTIIVGSVSKEYRMIGWRIGWVAAPTRILADISRVHIYNVVTASGIAQAGACAALRLPDGEINPALAELQRRRDAMLEQLRDMPVIPAAGGWSMILDVGRMGHDSFTASQRLLDRGKIAATPMRDWGAENSDQFVRLVFSNEPVSRLARLRESVVRALDSR